MRLRWRNHAGKKKKKKLPSHQHQHQHAAAKCTHGSSSSRVTGRKYEAKAQHKGNTHVLVSGEPHVDVDALVVGGEDAVADREAQVGPLGRVGACYCGHDEREVMHGWDVVDETVGA